MKTLELTEDQVASFISHIRAKLWWLDHFKTEIRDNKLYIDFVGYHFSDLILKDVKRVCKMYKMRLHSFGVSVHEKGLRITFIFTPRLK
jgi:hypothetical protein